MLLRTHYHGFSLTRLVRLGPTAVRAVLGNAERGEMGSATGSCRADDLLFGPDMNATGNSIGRTYLGVPRMHPIAGTRRSLGKLLCHELCLLYKTRGGSVWTWDQKVHPWVFCSFDKTLTALWHGARKTGSGSGLRYRWKGIVPVTGPANDPRFFFELPDTIQAVWQAAQTLRKAYDRPFVARELGFFGARPSPTRRTIVLDAICLRARAAKMAGLRVRHDEDVNMEAAAMCRSRSDRAGSLQAEASARRFQELGLALQLWTDQMLDLAYWMQRTPNIRKRGYTDGDDLDESACLLLYPHGRRFVSIYDTPDLVPWLPYTSACQERNYWAPTGAPSMMAAMSGGARSTTVASGGGGNCHGMAILAHMVLSKSNPHPCKIRNLDQIAVRNALDDPPVGLATMDMVHILLMGNMPGCRIRPSFAVRSRIRVQSLAFRGATAAETVSWMRTHYRLLHLAFKEWYAQTVRWSPAYEAVIADVQHHAEYVACGRRASDEIRGILSVHGSVSAAKVAHLLSQDPDQDYIQMADSCILDDAAHMCHGLSLRTLGKLRKGSFVITTRDRMRGWLRALCTGKDRMAQQYKEELTQMMVLSKILYSQPEYGARIVEAIEATKLEEAAAAAATATTQTSHGYSASGGDTIHKWALGAPLASLPTAVISSFLKWEGDSALSVSPWFVDRSFFLEPPYAFLDKDTLRSIDLVAWMCARRTDGRFVTSWLRFPIGLSAQAYQRLRTLYFSYEFCDVADNSFLVQLRRFLFRRRRRAIPAAEYLARKAANDPSIVDAMTEQVVSLQEGGRVVVYRIVEEYGTPESRRDFAILYEYVNRVVAYNSWSVIPLGTRITQHQIEAVKRRQTIEPWRLTDVDLLGSRHMCACGRWCCQVVGPTHMPVTSSVTERQRTPSSALGMDKLLQKIQADTEPGLLSLDHQFQADKIVLEQRFDAQQKKRQRHGDGAYDEAAASIRYKANLESLERTYTQARHKLVDTASEAMFRTESEQPVLYNVVPTRRTTKTSRRRGSVPTASMSAVSALDTMDLRLCAGSSRWSDPDYVGGRQTGSEAAAAAAKVLPKKTKKKIRGTGISLPLLSAEAEPVSRDVHPSMYSYMMGDAFVRCDLDKDHLVSKERNRATYCKGRLFQINLLGCAVRPKGPKAPQDGPWYTLCTSCGCLTTVDPGRWSPLRGPTCGAHGRPHRLPDRLAPFHDRVEGRALWLRLGTEIPNMAGVASQLRSDLSRLDANAGLSCPEEVPCCWYCNGSVVTSRNRHLQQQQQANQAVSAPPPQNLTATVAEQIQAMQPTVRYQVGTSVATATIGSAGGALYAQHITTGSTDQTVSVRRINVRGSMFGHLGGVHGGGLLMEAAAGSHGKTTSELCVTGRCDCTPEMAQKRHSTAMTTRTLPAELLPVVADEMCLKVLDDVDPASAMRMRWVFLCPIHMKDLRIGWIATQGRLIQIDAKTNGVNMALNDSSRQRAAEGKRIGKEVIIQHLFHSVPLLSLVVRALRRGHKTRVRQNLRFGAGQTDMRSIPDYSQDRKNRQRSGQ